MKTNIQLFFAGSIGAVIGGLITHHYARLAGVTNFCVILVTFLGLMIGCLIASFVYDPQGSARVVASAVKAAFPVIGKILGAIPKIVGTIVIWLAFNLSKVLVTSVFILLSGVTWFSVFFVLFTIETSVSVFLVNISCVSMLCAMFGMLIMYEGNFFNDKNPFEEFFVNSFEANLRASFRAMIQTNTFVLTSRTVLKLFRLRGKIATAIKTVIRSIIYFLLLFVSGLTACQRRSAAMLGACVGTILGLFFSDPVILGLSGGVTAVLAHFIACTLQARISDWMAQLRFEKSS